MPSPFPQPGLELAATVLAFAERSRPWPDFRLESGVWSWDDYAAVRYAHLHTVMTLRALAARLRVLRERDGPAQTLVQHALGDSQIALRVLQGLLAPLPAELYEQPPAPMEHSLRVILAHVHQTEHLFSIAIRNALGDAPGGGKGREPSEEEMAASMGAGRRIMLQGTPPAAWAELERTHAAILEEFGGLTDIQAEQPSTMWESIPYPILFRLWRYGAHMREHTIQVEKTLAWLGVQPNEADLHARQIYAALGEVEAAQIGAPALGREVCLKLGEELDARYLSLYAAWDAQDRFIDALRHTDLETTRALLQERPALAATRIDEQLTALLHALYTGQQELVEALRAAAMGMTLHEAAAMGEAARIERILQWYPEQVNAIARDGFTPLQLACYFARADAVRTLLDMGADPERTSTNASMLRALHSAVAGRSAAVVRLLLDAGAAVNARQADGLTPLMAARQNGDAEIEAMLLAAGAAA